MTELKPSLTSDNYFFIYVVPAVMTILGILVIIALSWGTKIQTDGIVLITYVCIFLIVIWLIAFTYITLDRNRLVADYSDISISFIRKGILQKKITTVDMTSVKAIDKNEYYGPIYGPNYMGGRRQSHIWYQYFTYDFFHQNGEKETVQLNGWDPKTVNKLIDIIKQQYPNITITTNPCRESPNV